MTDELPMLAEPVTPISRAAADQLNIQTWELGLLAVARVQHPTVAWWHGYRAAETGFGSFCYVCDEFIVKWGGNGSPPVPARTSIDQHKNDHRVGMVPATDDPQRKEQAS